MRNLNLFAATTLMILFVFTSCQKEEITLNNAQNTERAIPAEGIHTVNEDAKTAAGLDLFENDSEIESRALYARRVDCNTGKFYSSNRGATSSINAYNSPCMNPDGDSFNGEDKFYFFKVQNESEVIVTHNFILGDLTDDLDLFLYTLDVNGRVRDCKATSVTIGTDDETIEVQGLNEGYYLLVVDGWIEQAVSDYSLEIYCTAVSADPPSTSILDEAVSVAFGTKYSDGGFSEIGKIYRADKTSVWKQHIWNIPHLDIFDNDPIIPEVDRDEWSLYLYNETSQGYVQLDFYTEKVIYRDVNFNITSSYDMLNID